MPEFGSMINEAYAGPQVVTPYVGMPCTVLAWSDRYAATIVAVNEDIGVVKVQRDEAIRIDNNGMSEDQKYKFRRDSQGTIYTFKRDDLNRWRNESQYGLLLGIRKEYYDFSF